MFSARPLLVRNIIYQTATPPHEKPNAWQKIFHHRMRHMLYNTAYCLPTLYDWIIAQTLFLWMSDKLPSERVLTDRRWTIIKNHWRLISSLHKILLLMNRLTLVLPLLSVTTFSILYSHDSTRPAACLVNSASCQVWLSSEPRRTQCRQTSRSHS